MFLRATILLLAFMMWTASASAQICVELDASKDGLAQQEQRSAVVLLTDTFAGEGEETTDAPCDDVYKVYHLKFGTAVTVVVSGSKGMRKLRVGTLEEIPSAYSQIVRALLTGAEITSTDAQARDNITRRQADPNRVKADSLYYISLGPGMTVGADPAAVNTALGFGYRYELDNMALDVSYRVMLPTGGNKQTDDGGTAGGMLNLMGLYFTDPMGANTLYFGGGMGLGAVAFKNDDTYLSNDGLMGSAAVGYEFMRTSTIRFFVEAVVQLPFFESTDQVGNNGQWAPMMSLSVGGAWVDEGRRRGCCF